MPHWSDLKSKLADLDRARLIRLVHDLYAASKDNQALLHAHFSIGSDALQPFKATINRWLRPDILMNQDISVAKAKKAISDYKKAADQPENLAELMVFYCECAAGFSHDVGLEDEGYFDALVRMFERALKITVSLPEQIQTDLLQRLGEVRSLCRTFGYGVSDAMDLLLVDDGLDG